MYFVKKVNLLIVGLISGLVCECKNFLLTPKAGTVMDWSNFNMDVHSNFDDFVVYKTSYLDENMTDFFDYEEDGIVTIPTPMQSDKFLYVQNPNQNHFDVQEVVPWHLGKMTGGNFTYSNAGSCHMNTTTTQIDTYILDTGIDVEHEQFNGRATWLANFANDNVDTDCNSHGTHCAGLVGSETYGVCKDANLFAVKVLDCRGSGSFSNILKGLEFVYRRHTQRQLSDSDRSDRKRSVRSIISMSLGASYSRMINRAVEKVLTNESIYVVVAAGNENSDACDVSPASAKGVITVMASDQFDNRAYFSNYGTCADIYSPGVDIISTVPGNSSAVYSGTSMATPNLVGVLNHYLDMYPHLNNLEMKEKLLADALKNMMKNNPQNTPNLFINLKR